MVSYGTTLNAETHLDTEIFFFAVFIKLEFKHEIVLQKEERAGNGRELALEHRL